MIQKVKYHTDVDGICITPCPYGQRYNRGTWPMFVGSYAENIWCPNYKGDCNGYVKCSFKEQTKKEAVQ